MMFPTYEIHVVLEPAFFRDLSYAVTFIAGGITVYAIINIFRFQLPKKLLNYISQKESSK